MNENNNQTENNNQPTETKQPTYKYQEIVDKSPTVDIKKQISEPDKEFIKQLIRELSDILDNNDSITVPFICSPPDKIQTDSDNAPAYIPPYCEELTPSELARWILFFGPEAIYTDSYSKQAARSRKLDKEFRSPNFEKFQDEEFIQAILVGRSRVTIKELQDKKDWMLACACAGLDYRVARRDEKTGAPVVNEAHVIDIATEGKRIFGEIREIDNQIKAKRRDKED